MNWATDDLAGIIINAGREVTGRAQGIIRAFNSDTFENTVNVRGTDLHNLAVSASGLEALSYRPGDVVIVEKWKPRSGRGSATYSISSRWLDPAQGRAEEAIAWMRGELAKQISAEVFAERIHVTSDTATVSTTSTSYVSLTGGPTVSDVEITAVGRAIVFVTGLVTAEQTGDGTTQAVMSFEVSGATSRSPVDLEARLQSTRLSDSGTIIVDTAAGASNAVLVEGLNPGVHEFSARYRSFDGDLVEFSNRSLIVIGF